MAEIRLVDLQKRFGDFQAVVNTNLHIRDGQFVVFLGPSGCGKTTTLRMVAGLEYPTAGSIHLGADDVTYLRPRHRDVAMVFQLFALYPHMTVRENLEFPLRNEGVPYAELRRRVQDAAAILRIEPLLDSRIGGLAGGDRQRIALGRAIVRQPKAFLMDEPLGTLDAEFREVMSVELRRLHERLRTTTIFVTHDQNEAMALADRIVVMDQGRILQDDDPHGVYDFPSCLFVARFIGRPPMNLLPLPGPLVVGQEALTVGGSRLSMPRMLEGCVSAVLGIRPEHVRLVDQSEGLSGQALSVEYFGSHWIVDVATELGVIKAMVGKDKRPVEGMSLGVVFMTERMVLFDSVRECLLRSESTVAHLERH